MPHHPARLAALLAHFLPVAAVACGGASANAAARAPSRTRAATVAVATASAGTPAASLGSQAPQGAAGAAGVAPVVVAGQPLSVYDGGLRNGWQDWGWAHRNVGSGLAARLNMSKYAGWILGNHALVGNWVTLQFAVKAPAGHGDFLEVRLGADGAPNDAFARVPVDTTHHADAQGFVHVAIPIQQLNPQALDFDRVVFRARASVGTQDVAIDKVALIAGAPNAKPTPAALAALPARPVKLRIRCDAPGHPISDGIYGIAFTPRKVGKDNAPFAINAAVRRWGGNPASRYNWKLGNAWNTASDWFYKNVNYTDNENYSWRDFLQENEKHGMRGAMTVPMMGWVAKDTSSYSFSQAALGKQKYAQADAGNGVDERGQKLRSPNPTTTSLAASPAFVGEWVKALEAYQKEGHAGSVWQYILDNEPALWNSTHRDVHPEALTYDELLERTVAYGEAVRAAAPTADIAGPAEWGWPAYFYSARDQEVGFRAKPDRRAHGDVPLLAWYLRKLHQRAEKTGVHVLDTVDLHYYPQISGVYGQGEQTTPQGAARRVRATRSLWDKTYKDESWIADNIELLPRMRRLIAENYPGRKISIGEYNFGGEHHISGALALAESLGRFAEYGVHSAYLWTYPPEHSPAQQAFLAFRNYDGEGASFQNNYVPTDMAPEVSLFASRDAKQDSLVAIALNLQADSDADAEIELQGCGAYTKVRRFALSAGATNLTEQLKPTAGAKSVRARLPGYSVNVIELRR